MLFAGQVGAQRQNRGPDGATALNQSPDDHAVDVGGQGCDHAAHREYQQADGDDRFAADTIGKESERDLQQGLSKPVDAQSQAHREIAVAGQMIGIQRKHGINHEQAEHSERKDPGQREGRPTLVGGHAIGVRGS